MKTEPFYILFNSLYILNILFYRVSIVKAKIALAAVFLGSSKIYSNRLGVAYMQISVGLRGKTGLHMSVNPFL